MENGNKRLLENEKEELFEPNELTKPNGLSYPINWQDTELVLNLMDKLTNAEPKPLQGYKSIFHFFDGLFGEFRENSAFEASEGPDKYMYSTRTWRSKTKKPIALDFMGTLNHPKSKGMIWQAVYNAIIQNDTEALEASSMTREQISQFKQYITETGCEPMNFRDYALAQDGVKKAIGAYCSIGAEAGQLNFCNVYDDVVDFLTIAKALGHPVEIFSTIGAPEGYRNLSQIMLGNQTLSEDYQLLLKCFGEEAQTATDLVTEIVVNKKKKTEPGQAVLEETADKGLHLYVDDEVGNEAKPGVIDDTVRVFGSQQDVVLPVLCRIEREGVKNPGYKPSEQHGGIDKIVTATSLMDKELLSALYLP